MATEVRKMTNVTIAQKSVVVRTDKDFTDGLCSGYLTYFDRHQDKPLTDSDVYDFLTQNIMDVRGTATFNAGYCTGWIEALLEDRDIFGKGEEA